jgi:signal transduction histidine kinase/ActR/RegA family two-component response regulator
MRGTLQAFIALGDRAGRPQAAREVAHAVGAEDFLVLIRDDAIGTLVPAPGFAQTLRGGPTWRQFVAKLPASGHVHANVEIPVGSPREAHALAGDGICVVLLGGAPKGAEVEHVESLMPLLAAMLRAEQRVELSASEAVQSKADADRANVLAAALDAARAEGAKLNAELREEHRRKDEFLAMLCHELRNPLAPLVICIDMLRRRGIDPKQTARCIEIAARQTGQLSRLVEDLLDVSRVSRGRIELRRRPISLESAVVDAVETSRAVLESRRHVIVVELPDEPLVVNADAVRLAQILANLLHNASKYTDPGGRIEVKLSREGQEAVLSVADTGIGIAKSTLPHVFELFAQAPVALGRSQGGLGIGLTLVRSLSELHGGRASAHSDGVGKGARFTVRLPLITSAVVGAMPSANAPVDGRPLRILMVDDNCDAADCLADVARSMGHHAEVAYSGPTALEIARDGTFDLVMLDIGLPEMDGYEVARRLRHMVARDTRIVALTGYGTDEDKRRSREAGFDEHVVKPLMPEKLSEILARTGRETAVQAG